MKKLSSLLAFVFLSAVMFAQVKVTGVITDAEDNTPVVGAAVMVKGTTSGVVTDLDGKFTISIAKVNTVLQVVNLGYLNEEFTVVAGKTNYNIVLKRDNNILDEVVVTGFKNEKKETFTGASVKLSAEDIAIPGVSDISRMLEGQVAGVSVQNVSSTFGSAPKVRVRGVTSLSGENKPLWVVDGVVLEDVVEISNDQLSSGDPTTLLGSSVAGINSADIASFDILKDAAATALYGARAMNGVIVITTKKGRVGKPQITYNGNFTIREKPRYSQFDIMNSADQMAVYSELERKGLLDQSIVNASNSGVYGLMYKAINTYNPETGKFGLENTVAARRAFLMDYAKANTDWFDILFTRNLLQEHSLSVSTGTEKSRTYASLSFLNDAGWSIADKVSRYTFNFKNDYNVSEKITLGFQAVASLRQQDAPGSYSREVDTVSGNWSRDFDINPFSYAFNTSRAIRPYDNAGNLEYVTMNYAPFNILNELSNNQIKLNVIDAKVQGNFNYKIVDGLNFDLTGMLRYVKSDQIHRVTEDSNVAGAYRADYNSTIRSRNRFLWTNPDDPAAEPIVVLPYGGFYNTTNNTLLNYEVRASFAYNKVFEGTFDHELNLLAGTQFKYLQRTKETAINAGYQYNMGGVVYNDPNYFKMMSDRQLDLFSSSTYQDRFAAFYANADYTFDHRFALSATLRVDGSNALGKNASARWLPTWNFGGKWNVMNEHWMEDASWLNVLAVRASYGLNASMPPVSNAAAIYYTSEAYRPGYTENQIEIGSLANSELTWEKSYQFNAGFDFVAFRNRFNFSVDYFTRNSFDLIAPIKTSGIGGQKWKMANYADLFAHGVDVTLGGTLITKRDFGWNMNFTFGYSENEIRNCKNLPEVYNLVRLEGGNKDGYPVNSLFSIPFAGLDPETGIPLFYNRDGEKVTDIEMQDTDVDFLKYEGTVDPKITGGLNTSLRYKNFSLNAFFSYQMGSVIRLTPAYSTSYSDLDAMSNEFKNRFTMTGDSGTPAIPDWVHQTISLSDGYPYINYNYSTARVVKGDFIRLKSVSLNYNIPEKLLEKTKVFRTLGVRLTVKDPWLIYADPALHGQDPEFFNTGGVAMPTTTQYTVSLNIGF